MKFFLGTHEVHWLRDTSVPLFVSAIRLRLRPQKLPASCEYAIDLGGFSALNKYGRWITTPQEEVDSVRRWSDAMGPPAWVSVQDWMCEEVVLKKTGLTVPIHQRLTVESWIELNRLAPEIPWVPVLQGYTYDEYFSHVELYRRLAGLDLRTVRTCGIGSVCRREDTGEAEEIITDLHAAGFRNLHGFGFKIDGLARVGQLLQSADSLAWSDRARRAKIRLDGCRHNCCANCKLWAMEWRKKVLASVGANRSRPIQRSLFSPCP